MLRIFKKSLQTGVVSNNYPTEKNVPPPGFRGLPECTAESCRQCGRCAEACPTKAIQFTGSGWSVEPKSCIFCGYCQDACANDALRLGEKFELAELACREKINKIFGRSAHIRHLDAGSCNACDWEMTALTGPVYDVQRLGFDFVASPRHADILMVTGPVTRNLEFAALDTFRAAPFPKLVVAAGTCACSGGVCGRSYASAGGVNQVLPVDVFIPGCPPRPQALIYGLMKAVSRL